MLMIVINRFYEGTISITQLTFVCSKSTIEKLEKDVKYVQLEIKAPEKDVKLEIKTPERRH